ncbi:TetR/AcrR family transcriptional regulator [Phytopseudomonas punonensis]|uniref:Transcriptional regulator, TetR family n=1 Tax=Phytopseudomonas punonensis TaxID=1220495 RepID=A0A1M7F5B4_9GAMM|nr:TetR/AcrR family transcriptional regulator [Pseudomonas punonensis]SHL99251.1 transcriptional regulator, TetR family [Pseudomonas punonensis]
MRVSKAQAQANRALIVETASHLFRERGYDGVGVADLMAAAGFTHGGFYKHFGSKADLVAESAACGISKTLELTQAADAAQFFDFYVSRKHRDSRDAGCTLAALGGDAARQAENLKSIFADGIDSLLATLARNESGTDGDASQEQRATLIGQLAQAVGAIVLSRACPDDSALADEIINVCRAQLLAVAADEQG